VADGTSSSLFNGQCASGCVGLWSPRWKRFVRMPNSEYLDWSGTRDDGTLPPHWTDERLKVVQAAGTSTTRYSYWHQGHCAGGWLGARSVTDIDGCADQCAETSTCGYFIFDDSNANCHLYSLAAGCPNDGKYLSYKAYKLMAF